MDCSPPSSSVHEIFQERILEWVAISSSWGSFQPRGRTWVSCIAGRFFKPLSHQHHPIYECTVETPLFWFFYYIIHWSIQHYDFEKKSFKVTGMNLPSCFAIIPKGTFLKGSLLISELLPFVSLSPFPLSLTLNSSGFECVLEVKRKERLCYP